MMNLHNHALSAVLQNGCYTYIPLVCMWLSLIGRVELIPTQYGKYSIMQYIIIFHSTLWGYESHRTWLAILQQSCITRVVCYKRKKLGQKFARKNSVAWGATLLKSKRTLYPNSWWHFVQLLTSEKWVTSCEWHPHKRSPGENWQQFNSNLFWFWGEMLHLLSNHLYQCKTHHHMPVGEWLHTLMSQSHFQKYLCFHREE